MKRQNSLKKKLAGTLGALLLSLAGGNVQAQAPLGNAESIPVVQVPVTTAPQPPALPPNGPELNLNTGTSPVVIEEIQIQEPATQPGATLPAPMSTIKASPVIQNQDKGTPGGDPKKSPQDKGTKDLPPVQPVGPDAIIVPNGGPAVNGGFAGNGNDDGSGFSFGLGFYWMQAYSGDNRAFRTNVNTLVNGNPFTSTTVNDFHKAMDLSPRAFLEYDSDCGIGARIGWWRYDQVSRIDAAVRPNATTSISIDSVASDAGQIRPFFAPGDTGNIAATSALILDVWDFDVTVRLMHCSDYEVTGGVGIRTVHLSQNYDFLLKSTGLVFPNSGQQHTSGVWDVGGPTVFVEGKRCLNSGLSVYANARTGILFGRERVDSFVFEITPPGFFSSASVSHEHGVLPFVEGEAGIEWMGAGGGAVQPFARVGVTGQCWFNTGTGSQPNSNSNLGFAGLSFMFGLNF